MNRAEKATLLVALLLLPVRLHAAPPEFQIDLKELDRQQPAATQKPAKKPAAKAQKQAPKEKEPARKHGREAKKEPAAKPRHETKKECPTPAGEHVRYTIKPGDHIFKILVGRFGLSNDAAERLVPEIVELNDIKNIRTLEVGDTLLIPAAALHGHEGKTARKEKEKKREKPETPAAKATHGRDAQQAHKAPAEAPRAPEPAAAAPRAPEPVAEVPRAPEPVAEVPRAPEPAAPVPVPVPAQKAAPLPKPAPAPVPRPVPAPAAKPAPSAEAKPAPQPAPVAPKAAPPVAVPAPPAIPQATTWVCQVAKHETAAIVDDILNAVSATWSRNKIMHSAAGAATPFSIRVDRYFEYKGARYIVSIGENDPYNYTLLRILETAGYRVLMLTGKEDFQAVARKLFKLVGVTADFGPQVLQEGRQATGFLVQQDDAAGRRVLVTDTAPPPGHKWVMPAGCATK